MNRVSGFVHGKLVLDDREPGLRDRGAFIESAPLGAEIAVDHAVTSAACLPPTDRLALRRGRLSLALRPFRWRVGLYHQTFVGTNARLAQGL